MIINTSTSLAWQKRRSDYSHDWLQNSFCTGKLERWLGFIKNTIEGSNFTLRQFESTIAEEWLSRSAEVLRLTQEYELSMSPATLFEKWPLSRMNTNTKNWLRPFSIAIWNVKYGSNEKIERIKSAYECADSAFHELQKAACILDNKSSVSDSLFSESFLEFKKLCYELGKSIHCLENSVKVI